MTLAVRRRSPALALLFPAVVVLAAGCSSAKRPPADPTTQPTATTGADTGMGWFSVKDTSAPATTTNNG